MMTVAEHFPAPQRKDSLEFDDTAICSGDILRSCFTFFSSFFFTVVVRIQE